ncbi:spore-associated protein A [Microtetraspora sp. AC03309]|uniref:spore-associated protein A n=1 Tax=Microtetraspora sp. AC03309 TaxID=2779376 RepID=UPI001E48C561|nr:spore-associated protein A [Microtetraspora sp. AC03309]MCC5580357.1 spore-associated protein A [Microtetraspora sp. AC03309]
MRVLSKRMATMGAVLLAASGLFTIGASSASATGPCGSGYTRVGVYNIGSPKAGSIEVFYNSSNGYNCALTYPLNPGERRWMLISIGISIVGAGSDQDNGYYTTYAGPVYTYAKGQCIDLVGGVDNGYGHVYRNLKNVHCG